MLFIICTAVRHILLGWFITKVKSSRCPKGKRRLKIGRRCRRLWKASCTFQKQPGSTPKPPWAPLALEIAQFSLLLHRLTFGSPSKSKSNEASTPFQNKHGLRIFCSQAYSGCRVLFNAQQPLEVSLLFLSFQPKKLKLEAVK